MKPSKLEIAEWFSHGKFKNISEFLNEEIIWNTIGEAVFKGKKEVVKQCNQIAEYFASVETHFKTENIITTENKVIITGTAEFKKDGKQINFISACDIYEFDATQKISHISSYCIALKQ